MFSTDPQRAPVKNPIMSSFIYAVAATVVIGLAVVGLKSVSEAFSQKFPG